MRISLTAAEVQSWSSRSGLDVPSLAAAKATGLTADVYPNGNIGPVWAGAVMLVDGAALPCIQWYLHRHLWQYRTLDDVRELVGDTDIEWMRILLTDDVLDRAWELYCDRDTDAERDTIADCVLQAAEEART